MTRFTSACHGSLLDITDRHSSHPPATARYWTSRIDTLHIRLPRVAAGRFEDILSHPRIPLIGSLPTPDLGLEAMRMKCNISWFNWGARTVLIALLSCHARAANPGGRHWGGADFSDGSDLEASADGDAVGSLASDSMELQLPPDLWVLEGLDGFVRPTPLMPGFASGESAVIAHLEQPLLFQAPHPSGQGELARFETARKVAVVESGGTRVQVGPRSTPDSLAFPGLQGTGTSIERKIGSGSVVTADHLEVLPSRDPTQPWSMDLLPMGGVTGMGVRWSSAPEYPAKVEVEGRLLDGWSWDWDASAKEDRPAIERDRVASAIIRAQDPGGRIVVEAGEARQLEGAGPYPDRNPGPGATGAGDVEGLNVGGDPSHPGMDDLDPMERRARRLAGSVKILDGAQIRPGVSADIIYRASHHETGASFDPAPHTVDPGTETLSQEVVTRLGPVTVSGSRVDRTSMAAVDKNPAVRRIDEVDLDVDLARLMAGPLVPSVWLPRLVLRRRIESTPSLESAGNQIRDQADVSWNHENWGTSFRFNHDRPGDSADATGIDSKRVRTAAAVQFWRQISRRLKLTSQLAFSMAGPVGLVSESSVSAGAAPFISGFDLLEFVEGSAWNDRRIRGGVGVDWEVFPHVRLSTSVQARREVGQSGTENIRSATAKMRFDGGLIEALGKKIPVEGFLEHTVNGKSESESAKEPRTSWFSSAGFTIRLF